MGKVTSSAAKRKANNWPLRALACGAALAAEAVTIALLWQYEPDHLVGLMWSAVTGCLALAGICVSGEAQRRKVDPRREVQETAFVARVVSVLLILPSAFVGGGAVGLKMQDRAALAYAGSEAYASTLLLSRDESASSRERAQASLDLERGIRPNQVRMDDPAFFGGVLSMFLIMLAPVVALGVGQGEDAETPAQRKRREEREDRAERRRDRKERERRKEALVAAERVANRPSFIKGLFERKPGFDLVANVGK